MPAAPVLHTHGSNPNVVCPNCGTVCATNSQQRIAELEAQIRLLTDKATAAADKVADYEDELQSLKSSTSSATTTTTAPATTVTRTLRNPSGKFSPLPSPRSSPNPTSHRINTPPPPPATPANPRETELSAQLAREQTLRQDAETKVTQMSGELEELSAQLFQQANEMVAAERRARARLEERVEVLEKRDGEKRRRLERLEGAVKRIERVRVLLGGSDR